MFHHASLCVPDPAEAACGLALLLAADVLRAPSPPFPAGSWFVVMRDQVGSMIEVLPADTIYRPDVPGGLAQQAGAASWAQTHFLFSTPLSQATINATAAKLGWQCDRVDSGLFAFTKVWVQNCFLIELMTPAQAGIYRRRFGLGERDQLDGRLRRLERLLSTSPRSAD